MPSSAKTLCLESPAKLNLFLDVINKRPDGYHNIVTLFERISLCDTIRLFAIHSDEIVVSCGHPDVPLDHLNLAWRAAELIKKSRDIKIGVKIEIDKHIPVGGGLGGGSSNAATVLIGLSRLFKLKLDQETLKGYANRLGSDVAFFILNKSFALGEGRGGDLKRVSVPQKLKLWHLLFIPSLKVMTRDIYGAHKSLALTKKPSDVNILIRYLRGKNIPWLNRSVYNELSATVIKSYRLVSEIRADLLKFGLKYVHMSGSGPALFSIHKTRQEAQGVLEKISRRLSHRCSTYLVSTL